MDYRIYQLDNGSIPGDSPLVGSEISIEADYADRSHDILRSPGYSLVDDPEWSVTDSHGHEHVRDEGKFPTLRPVYETVYACGCCTDEDYERLTHWECIGCGDRVSDPGKKQVPHVSPYRPTMTHVKLYRTIPNSEPHELLGDIEPVSWTIGRDETQLEYDLRHDEWTRIVEAHNESVLRHVEEHAEDEEAERPGTKPGSPRPPGGAGRERPGDDVPPSDGAVDPSRRNR